MNSASISSQRIIPRRTLTAAQTQCVDRYAGKAQSGCLESAGGKSKERTLSPVSSSFHFSSATDMRFMSKDGDSWSFSLHTMHSGKKAGLDGTHPYELNALVGEIKDQFVQQKKRLLDALAVEGDGPKKPSLADGKVESAKVSDLPDFWNAENTSQRIIDFATSFYSLFKGDKQEYASLVRDAIEDGFAMAREKMGELPEEVRKLTDDTYQLVMEKLDAWAKAEEQSEPPDERQSHRTFLELAV